MRSLLVFLCLGFGLLLFNEAEASELPPCPGSYNSSTWHNCFDTYTWPDGSKYVGEWGNGEQHGHGTYTYANGNRYVGKFRDGTLYGEGIYTSASGNKYVGQFRDDLPNGRGTYTFDDGRVEKGIWEDGKKISE